MEFNLKPEELFKRIERARYKKSGTCVDWAIEIDQENKAILVLFYGSNEAEDWKASFNFPIKPYKKQQSCMLVARGWCKAWKSANDEIVHAIDSVIDVYDNYSVIVSGYSFGGAMAVFCAEDLYFRTKVKPILVTFGSPKPAFGFKTRKYLRSCCLEAYQYASRNDIVTVAPPFLGYMHVRKVPLGERFNVFKLLFKARKYHTEYGEKELYIKKTP